MNDEDIDIDDDENLEDLEDESRTTCKSDKDDADSRRRLEERLEQARLRKLTQDFDFD